MTRRFIIGLILGIAAVVVCVGIQLGEVRSERDTGTTTRLTPPTTPESASIPVAAAEPSRETLPAARAVVSSYIPNTVRPAIEGPFHDRLNAIHSLGRTLSPDERQALYEYLASVEQYDNPQSAGGVLVLKNDVINALRSQQTPPPELTGVLIALFKDTRQDWGLRDYAIQHLSAWYDVAPGPQDRYRIRSTLIEALGETEHSIAGTSLLALRRLGEKHPEVEKEQLRDAAVNLLSGSAVSKLTRTAAVQVCARIGAAEALPLVQNMAENETDIPLRIAAIAALGDLGGSESIRYVQELLNDENQRLKPAAELALVKLNKRTGSY